MLISKIINILRTFFCSFFYKNYGRNSVIQNPKCLIRGRKNIYIGKNVFIRCYARIETIKSYEGQIYYPELRIGDGVNIEQSLHLICSNKVLIGDNVVISSNVFISDCNHIMTDLKVPILKQGLERKETIIGRSTFIGTGAIIMPGVCIGEHCVIGANSVVTHNIADYSIAVGIPAVVIKQYNFVTNKWEHV